LEYVRRNQDYILGSKIEDVSNIIDNELEHGQEGGGGEADIQDDDVHQYDQPNDVLVGQVLNNFTPDQSGYRETTSKTFLGSNFHGSRRHLRNLATNGLIVVSEFGEPHLFITLTCNTEWPEIKEQLFYGQTAFDRYFIILALFVVLTIMNGYILIIDSPDVTVQVFNSRLKAFLHNLRAGKYFRNMHHNSNNMERISTHAIVYEMKCIEYQHRGLPHAHIVLRLTDMPDKHEENEQFKWIEQHIHSCCPRNEYWCKYYTVECRELVRKHMLHKCSTAQPNGCKGKDGICNRGYDALVLNEGR